MGQTLPDTTHLGVAALVAAAGIDNAIEAGGDPCEARAVGKRGRRPVTVAVLKTTNGRRLRDKLVG